MISSFGEAVQKKLLWCHHHG